MDCKQFRSLISSYIDNELSPNNANILLQHTNTCKNCKNYLKNLLIIKANTKKVFSSDFNIDLSKSIMRKVRAIRSQQKVVALKPKQGFEIKKSIKPIALAFMLFLFIIATFILNDFYNVRAGDVETFVVQHLESSTNKLLPNFENANFIQ